MLLLITFHHHKPLATVSLGKGREHTPQKILKFVLLGWGLPVMAQKMTSAAGAGDCTGGVDASDVSDCVSDCKDDEDGDSGGFCD